MDSEKPLILVVDDVEALRDLLQEIAAFAGFRAVTAWNATSATRAFMDHPEIRMVVSDLGMGPLDGSENGDVLHRAIVSELKARNGAFVLLHGGSSDTSYFDGLNVPIGLKPMDIGDLAGLICRAFAACDAS